MQNLKLSSLLVAGCFIFSIDAGAMPFRPFFGPSGQLVPPLVSSRPSSSSTQPTHSASSHGRSSASNSSARWDDYDEPASAPKPCARPLGIPTPLDVVRELHNAFVAGAIRATEQVAKVASAAAYPIQHANESAKAAVARGMPEEVGYAAFAGAASGTAEVITGSRHLREGLESMRPVMQQVSKQYGGKLENIPNEVRKDIVKGFSEAIESRGLSINESELERGLFRERSNQTDGEEALKWKEFRYGEFVGNTKEALKGETGHNITAVFSSAKHTTEHFISSFNAELDGRPADAQTLMNVGDVDAIKEGDDH